MTENVSENVPSQDTGRMSEGTELATAVGSGNMSVRGDEPPPLQTPHPKRKITLWVGVFVATMDLCVLPIVYYYALRFGTKLSLQDIFAIITAVYGMISFFHYGLRSLKLFRNSHGDKYRPIGWTKWGLLEFLHVNMLIAIALVEIELVVATAPSVPILRLCAMPSSTLSFYFGFLFLITAALTQSKVRLPFNMSSVPKGSVWRPAIYAFMEDACAIEARGGLKYRHQIMTRYEQSPLFRRMLLRLSYMWGTGLVIISIVTTALVMTLKPVEAFGVGWGVPWAMHIILGACTFVLCHHDLALERRVWREEKEKVAGSAAPSDV